MAGPATDSKAYMIEYFYAVVIGGMLGMLVGMVIARELGEGIYHDDSTSDGASGSYGYTQAGHQWVCGSTGVGVFTGILLLTLYRNSAAIKSTFTSLFSWKPASTEQNMNSQQRLLESNLA